MRLGNARRGRHSRQIARMAGTGRCGWSIVLYNHDLAPVAPAGRTWGVFSIFAMWMSDVHSVGGYTFAASLFFLGLTGWEVLLSMVVGITAVYFLMNLIGARR
jgi:cytosine/uracil/thiamine/allantoin permease